ncbi:MAG: hypothetical protein QM504_03360 [Pseudomonadota bacterium]
MLQTIYHFTDSTADKKILSEIKAHAKTVIRHEFRKLLTKENKDEIIQNCVDHYYIPIDIWHNLGPYDSTKPYIKNLILTRIRNFIKTGVYKQP